MSVRKCLWISHQMWCCSSLVSYHLGEFKQAVNPRPFRLWEVGLENFLFCFLGGKVEAG